MNVLYIRSGYKGIYSYFDRWIEEGFLHSPIRLLSSLDLDAQSARSIKSFQPDFAVIMVGDRVPSEWLTWLKIEGIPVYVWLTEDPFYTDISLQVIPHADVILTIDQNSADVYRELGCPHVYYMPIPTNQRLFKKLNTETSCHSNLLLIGYPYPNRVQLIKETANLPFTIRLIGKEWRKYLHKKTIKQSNVDIIDQWISPEKAVHYYNSADIVINPHRPYHFAFNKNQKSIQNISLNNRSFDIAACEAFQLVDLPAASPFSSFVSYHGINDFKRKAAYYLEHPEERKKAAALNYKETIPANTFDELPAKLLHIHLNC
ncbi:CgeB family protein [Bacillus atrophaeus]|uniref:CgeB family protein n=1 Tax=Bacillus atrophaeus TaxID=1452 RepID=UPI002DBFD265|nr:DUF3880 domain-containing protein [Bacillus atrophaeus]MEC1901783.1 DUF3880 domain-containing protein [Bacillus atrophaeus]MEC2398772.1 DUF3880 domain-containing protein [Bacillus atrophaeus]MED4436962.1 DUF3880 domain-containing protein [Bacillus atrophaeus]MED4567345.1 DUF3880 domain-containing protein [Bacillus atrophaeus]MED4573994.1 DUF3880 domain-containing protein [Bacillus atrophaeus]